MPNGIKHLYDGSTAVCVKPTQEYLTWILLLSALLSYGFLSYDQIWCTGGLKKVAYLLTMSLSRTISARGVRHERE